MLFVLGTMRSGSTLFSHLLFTNPRIIGVGEAWRTYQAPLDLNRTMVKLLAMRRTLYRRDQIFQDTLLHDHLLPNPNLLLHERILPVFLTRKPRPVLSSLMRAQIVDFQSWTQIETYYRKRLDTLGQYAERLRAQGPLLVVQYEDLVERTDATLASLQGALGLETPFHSNYAVHSFTGRRTGDQSPFIRTGRVIKDRKLPTVEIPNEMATRCEKDHFALQHILSVAG